MVSDLQVRFDCRFQLTRRGDPGFGCSGDSGRDTYRYCIGLYPERSGADRVLGPGFRLCKGEAECPGIHGPWPGSKLPSALRSHAQQIFLFRLARYFNSPRRTTRPGTRTLVDHLPPDAGGHAGWRCVVTAPLELHALAGWMSVSRPPSSGLRRPHHDAPLIGERAANARAASPRKVAMRRPAVMFTRRKLK